MTHEQLIAAIKARKNHGAFGLGIRLASDFVKTIQECVGVDACYKFAATKEASWHDVMSKAAKTLVFTNEDMELEEKLWEKVNGVELRKLKSVKQLIDGEEVEGDIELPKNTLMVFRHTLTSPRKDRDGDILRTKGARPDPKMLLLWNHVHTLPIGKSLGVVEHNDKRLKMISAIVDINDLSHDAAVMVDNDMGRFSHGFRALEFVEMKSADGTEGGGFDIKSFEIMEESLVSVPSNTDAEVDEVILSLVEGGKLTSPMMKAQGKQIRDKRSVRIPVKIDLDLRTTLDGKEIGNGATVKTVSGASTKCGGDTACGCGCQGAAARTSEEADGGGKTEADGKVAKPAKGMTGDEKKCPDCGKEMKDGKCECGYVEKGFCPTGQGGGIDNSCGRGGSGSGGGEGGGVDSAAMSASDAAGDATGDALKASSAEKNKRAQGFAQKAAVASLAARTAAATGDSEEATFKHAEAMHYHGAAAAVHGKGQKAATKAHQKAEDLHLQAFKKHTKAAKLDWSAENESQLPKEAQPTVKEAMATVIALASPAERATLKTMLDGQDEIDRQHQITNDYLALVGE